MSTKNRTGNRSSHTAVQKPSKSTPSAIPDPVAAAARMVELLNEMEAIIPDLTQPDITKIKRTSQGAKFGRALIPPMINAVNNYPPFQQRNIFDPAAAQDAVDYHGQMHPITQRMAAITMAMSYSMNHKLAISGEQALQLFQWAKRHVKQPEGGGARTYVDDLQSVLDRTINRRKPQKPASTPPSTTPSNTPPSTPHTQGFLAPSLSAKAKAKSDPDDDQILDLVHEIAKDPKK
ncbi:MAG TPA: hypothetical protein VNN08_04940 [Thermoanaerobaculia bacterium]|nr:hypothetical protein [Thermoanaerobaculia bacterium]